MLITEGYRLLQTKMHENPLYGMAHKTHAPLVRQFVDTFKFRQMLDYGCGKGKLKDYFPDLEVFSYDPAVERFSEPPDPREFVVCIDVLEHIEPECLEDVLDDLKRVTERAAFFTIGIVPALKVLEDGRNAHLIVKPQEWWMPKIIERFNPTWYGVGDHEFGVFVESK